MPRITFGLTLALDDAAGLLSAFRPYFWYHQLLATCGPSGCTVVSSVVVVVVVCNRSQMRNSECTCLIFGVSIGLDLGYKSAKGIFDRSKFKVTRDISPTLCGCMASGLHFRLLW